jgi:hypothetical protein
MSVSPKLIDRDQIFVDAGVNYVMTVSRDMVDASFGSDLQYFAACSKMEASGSRSKRGITWRPTTNVAGVPALLLC